MPFRHVNLSLTVHRVSHLCTDMYQALSWSFYVMFRTLYKAHIRKENSKNALVLWLNLVYTDIYKGKSAFWSVASTSNCRDDVHNVQICIIKQLKFWDKAPRLEASLLQGVIPSYKGFLKGKSVVAIIGICYALNKLIS